MKVVATFSLDFETMELLKAMAKRTDVPRSKLVQRALTMLFNEHAMEVRRAEGSPIWLAPVKPVTVPDPADPLTEPSPAPKVAPNELPAPPGVPSAAQPTTPATADHAPDADPHVAPMANGGPPRPAPFFPPRSRSVTLE